MLRGLLRAGSIRLQAGLPALQFTWEVELAVPILNQRFASRFRLLCPLFTKRIGPIHIFEQLPDADRIADVTEQLLNLPHRFQTCLEFDSKQRSKQLQRVAELLGGQPELAIAFS